MSGSVTREELELALEDPKMNALLRCHGLEINDAELLFDLMDADSSGFIDREECQCLMWCPLCQFLLVLGKSLKRLFFQGTFDHDKRQKSAICGNSLHWIFF